MWDVIRGRRAARRLVVAALITGGVLLGGTTAVGPARSVTAPSHGQAIEPAAAAPRPAWDHSPTQGVLPDWNRPAPGPAQSPHLSGEQAANVSSGNWSGLAQIGTTYTAISGSWTVPTIRSNPSPGVSSSWIGIDGYSNHDLIQIGTEQDIPGKTANCPPTGPCYYAWWEILPNVEQPITAIAVSPGDHMTAAISQVSPGSPSTPGTWSMSISDDTSHQSFSQDVAYGGSHGQLADSAEWIEEMTGVSPTQPPLANFGTANFTNLNFTASNPAASMPTLIRMVNSSSTTIAYPTIPDASELSVTYGQPSTTTTVTASPSPVGLGSTVTYSATVTGGSPTGSVTFSTGSTPLCTATLSSGSGSCTSTAAPLGTDLVFGTYSGGGGLSASTGSTNLVVRQPSQTAISVNPPGPVTVGTPVTYSATVTTNVSGQPTPTGTVKFTTGSTTLCTATLSNGSGQCNSSAAPAGTDPIAGTYSGNSVFGSSTGTTSIVVNNVGSQTAIGVDANPVAYGASVTYSATVTTSVSGQPTPTGSVTFTTGTTTLCTATLSSGSGTCSSSVAPVGTDTITGTYSGDGVFAGSTGSTSLVVNQASTQTSVAANPNPAGLGSSVSYSATVTTSATGVPGPTGSVTFTTGATTLCTATLSNGSGTCSSSAAPLGTDTISGAYSGDTSYTGSDGSASLVVEEPSQTAVSVNPPGPVAVGSTVTYSATVTTSVSGKPTPTGSVSFTTGTTTLCTANLVNGTGTCTSSAAPVGTDTISGAYSGDFTFAGSTGTTTLGVTKTPSQTSVGAAPNSVTHGASVTYSATVTTNGTGLPTPSGSITFTTGSTALCTATLSSGSGSCSTSAAPAGNDTVSGTYSGDAEFSGSAGTTTLVVSTPPPPPPPAPTHGYWLVGSDGGIFTFGSAQFYGSTGSLHLQRPVVGIVPTAHRGGYWLDASDGGIFAFGDAGFYGSIPGLGLHPAGSGLPNSLNAPIVGMVPSADGGGYFMVASDGGVFAFGDARFAGSCPGIGGCAGAAVAVMPDATGNGYWVVTQTGHVYTFGDAPYYGAPGSQGSPVTSAVRTPDGGGYWILFANGAIADYGDAGNFGSPAGQMGGVNPASAIFTTADGGGYWVAAANGSVANYGNAPNDGSMLGASLNGSIIAATGW